MKKTKLLKAIHEYSKARILLDKFQQHYWQASKAVGVAFRNQRGESGISLREMAKKLKVSPAYLSDVELGRRAFPRLWMKIK